MDLRTDVRRLWGLGAVVLAAVVLWTLLALDQSTPGTSGPHALIIEGPDGIVWNGTVQLDDDATVLGALAKAAQAGNFSVETRNLAGFGEDGCAGVYVIGIAGIRETATGGWDYHVSENDAWVWQPRGAACQGLEAGQAVRWVWVDPAA